jgi:hypothetical protein
MRLGRLRKGKLNKARELGSIMELEEVNRVNSLGSLSPVRFWLILSSQLGITKRSSFSNRPSAEASQIPKVLQEITEG